MKKCCFHFLNFLVRRVFSKMHNKECFWIFELSLNISLLTLEKEIHWIKKTHLLDRLYLRSHIYSWGVMPLYKSKIRIVRRNIRKEIFIRDGNLSLDQVTEEDNRSNKKHSINQRTFIPEFGIKFTCIEPLGQPKIIRKMFVKNSSHILKLHVQSPQRLHICFKVTCLITCQLLHLRIYLNAV